MSTTYEATGTIIHIGEVQQIKETFRKRAFVIEIGDGNYPQQVQFEVTKDNCTNNSAPRSRSRWWRCSMWTTIEAWCGLKANAIVRKRTSKHTNALLSGSDCQQ